jgi:DNA-binding NtrC family response regulator
MTGSAAAKLESTAESMPERRIRVLVVDDDPLVLESLRAWLEADPRVEVRSFASAEEALNASSGRSYDVCLLDYALGAVDGVMLGAMIRALNPAARLILMTGFRSSNLERQALEHGFTTVLAKPFAPRLLTPLLMGGFVA